MANKQIENRTQAQLVDELVKRNKRVEKLKQQLDAETIKLRELAKDIFAHSDRARDAASSIVFHGTNGAKVRINRQASFKRPTVAKRQLLQKLLGKFYSLLFEPVLKLTLKAPDAYDKLQAICKEHGIDLSLYIGAEETYSSTEGFFDTLAALSLNEKQRAGITEFMEANQQADRLSFLQTKSKGAKKHG